MKTNVNEPSLNKLATDWKGYAFTQYVGEKLDKEPNIEFYITDTGYLKVKVSLVDKEELPIMED